MTIVSNANTRRELHKDHLAKYQQQENQAYAYYSYLRYKNMIGAGGRPGSYFGLTLRLDMYYQDVMLIYDFFKFPICFNFLYNFIDYF